MKCWFVLVILLVVWSCTLISCGNATNEVHVTMTDHHFDVDRTAFKKGVTYHFIVENKGQTEHEFTIAPPRQGNETEEELDAKSLLDLDDVSPGQIRMFDFTFKNTAPKGTLEFECSYPGHYEAGMFLSIVVE